MQFLKKNCVFENHEETKLFNIKQQLNNERILLLNSIKNLLIYFPSNFDLQIENLFNDCFQFKEFNNDLFYFIQVIINKFQYYFDIKEIDFQTFKQKYFNFLKN